MAFGKKITSALRNAFSYAVHLESANDHDRKLGIAEHMIEFSRPSATGEGAAYEDRLRAVLMQTRTQYLDTLAEKKVAVALDARLSSQKLDDKDCAVEGMFYAKPQSGAEGGLVTLSDACRDSRHNAILLEKLARVLREGDIAVDLHAWTSTHIAISPEGMGAVASISDWALQGGASAALAKNPALRQPPAKTPSP